MARKQSPLTMRHLYVLTQAATRPLYIGNWPGMPRAMEQCVKELLGAGLLEPAPQFPRSARISANGSKLVNAALRAARKRLDQPDPTLEREAESIKRVKELAAKLKASELGTLVREITSAVELLS